MHPFVRNPVAVDVDAVISKLPQPTVALVAGVDSTQWSGSCDAPAWETVPWSAAAPDLATRFKHRRQNVRRISATAYLRADIECNATNFISASLPKRISIIIEASLALLSSKATAAKP